MEINASTVNDEKLLNILLERADCIIGDKGELFVYDESRDFSDALNLLRESETAFGGVFFGLEPEIVVAPKQIVDDGILRLRSNRTDDSVQDTEDTEAFLRLRRLLERTLSLKASDVHLRMDKERSLTEVSCRMAGEFVSLMEDQPYDYGMTLGHYAAVTLGKRQTFSVGSQVDATFEIETEVEQKDLKGQILTYPKKTKWRLSQIPLDEGTKVTIRALETGTSSLPALSELGLTKGHVKAFISYVNAAQGVVLMSGPTGSGKTTTINVALETIKPTRLIHSLEDPVEFKRKGRNHFSTPVNEEYRDPKTDIKTKSFQYYGKTLLRHDTDGLYFGEIRDHEAAAQFLRLASTGQVMVGTIHCNSSITIITTLAEQLGVPVTQLAAPGILKGLAHQRLVRVLCPTCKIPHSQIPDFFGMDSTLKEAYRAIEELKVKNKRDISGVHYRKNWGSCPTCSGKGEKGRTALFEMIHIDDEARAFIRDLRLAEWEQHLKARGWPSIQQHAEYKILDGLVDYRSVIEQVDNIVETDADELYKMMHERY